MLLVSKNPHAINLKSFFFLSFFFSFIPESSYFSGNRYVHRGDKTVMLLFDGNNRVLGLQTAVSYLTVSFCVESNADIVGFFTDKEINFAFSTVVFQIPKSNVEFKPLPWIKENDSFVLTAYFRHPRNICFPQNSSPSKNIGDKLLILNSSTSPQKFIQIPTRESELVGSAWTEGQCVYTMGRHCFKLKKFPINIQSCSLLFAFLLLYRLGFLK